MANHKNRLFRLAEILETQDVTSVLRQATLLLGLMLLISGGLYLSSRDTVWSIPLRDSIVGLGIGLITIQLIKAKHNLLAAYLALFLFGGWLISTAWDGSGIKGPSYAMLILIVIGSGLFIGKRAGYLTALVISLAGVGLLQAGRNGLLTNMDRPVSDIWVWITMMVTFFSAAHMIRVLLDQVDRALGRAHKEIEERVAAETALLDLNSKLELMVEARTMELVKSQAQYKLIAENVSDLIWTMDLQLKMSYASPSVERFLGYTPDEIIQLPLDQILTPASLEYAMLVFAEEIVLASQRPPEYGHTLELEYIHKDGSTSWNEASFSFLRGDDGNPAGLLGVSRNIDKRKRAEASLQESEARFHGFFTHSMDAMFLLDENGMITEVNPAAEKLFQFDQGEVVGKPVWEVQASRMPEEKRQPKALEMMRAGVEEAMRTGQASWINKSVEGEIQRPDGSLRQTQQTTFAIPLGDGFRLASIVRDITESKKAEAFHAQAEMEKRAGEMRQRLLDFSRDLLANVENVTEILEIVRTTANELVPHDIFSPYRLDEAEGVLRPMETHGHPWFSSPLFHDWKIPLGQGIIGDAARKEQALMVNNAHLDPLSIYPEGVREQIKVEHSIAIPIHSEGMMIGMLVFLRRSGNAYAQEDFETLQLLASFAGLAITNANIFANLEQRVAERTGELTASNERYRRRANEISLLHRLGNSLATGQDLDTTLQMLWVEINQVIPADAFYVAIYDEKTDIVNYPIFFYFGDSLGSSSRKLKEKPGLTGKIIFEKKTLYLKDMTSRETLDQYEIVDDNELELHTFLGIPLASRDGIIGMLSVQSKQVDAYLPEQIKLMESIAAQAALAIDKASLLDQLHHELEERHKLVAELEKKNDELERFAYTVSHDLRAPLVTIRGFMGYLDKDLQAGNMERAKSDVNRIIRSADNMQKMLEKLLVLSRAGRTVDKIIPISLEGIVRDVTSLLEGQINQKNVQIEIAEGLPGIQGDPTRLTQVMQNLIDNAVKFMGDQSHPRIEIGQREANAAENPVFFVRDNGMGIAPEHLERVFGLFNKLDAQAEGTGIGLATVKRIIETHGGRIWVESEGLGKGSTFCFTIPDNRSEMVRE